MIIRAIIVWYAVTRSIEADASPLIVRAIIACYVVVAWIMEVDSSSVIWAVISRYGVVVWIQEVDARIMVVWAIIPSYGDIWREGYFYADACIVQFLILDPNTLATHKYHLTCPIRNAFSAHILPVINRFSIHRVRFVDLTRVTARWITTYDYPVLRHSVAC